MRTHGRYWHIDTYKKEASVQKHEEMRPYCMPGDRRCHGICRVHPDSEKGRRRRNGRCKGRSRGENYAQEGAAAHMWTCDAEVSIGGRGNT
jgi:hypothetical protein